MSIGSAECLETFPGECLIGPAQRGRPVRPLGEGVGGTHPVVDEPAEGLRGPSRTAVRLGRHRVKDVGRPTVPGRAVVYPVRAEPGENSVRYRPDR